MPALQQGLRLWNWLHIGRRWLQTRFWSVGQVQITKSSLRSLALPLEQIRRLLWLCMEIISLAATWKMKLSSSEVDRRIKAKISHISEDGMGKEAWVESGGERRERKMILGDCEIHRKWNFPGGPMAKTPRSQCRGPRFNPWLAN